MSTLPFITDPNIRGYLTQRTGLSPDTPEGRAAVVAMGLHPGVQPPTGLGGDISAFLGGLYGSVENTVRGLVDLPLAAGRGVGLTEARVGPRMPSFVEQANPAAAGLGGLLGVLGQFVIPETLIGRLGAVQKLKALGQAESLGVLGRLGRVEAGTAARYASFLDDPGVAAFAAARGARTPEEIAAFAERLAPRFGLRTPEQAAHEFLKRAVQAKGRRGVGFFGGLGPYQMASRALPSAGSFALFEGVQPGDIGERVEAALHGGLTGAVLGALGAPAGLKRPAAMAREALAATIAFGGQPVVDAPIPGVVQTALFGGLAGALKPATDVVHPRALLEGLKGRKIELPEGGRYVFDARGTKPGAALPDGVRVTQEPGRTVFVLPRWMEGVTEKTREAAKLAVEQSEGRLGPEVERALESAGIYKRIVEVRRNAQGLPPLGLREHARLDERKYIVIPGEERPVLTPENVFEGKPVIEGVEGEPTLPPPPEAPRTFEAPPLPPSRLPRTRTGRIPRTIDLTGIERPERPRGYEEARAETEALRHQEELRKRRERASRASRGSAVRFHTTAEAQAREAEGKRRGGAETARKRAEAREREAEKLIIRDHRAVAPKPREEVPLTEGDVRGRKKRSSPDAQRPADSSGALPRMDQDTSPERIRRTTEEFVAEQTLVEQAVTGAVESEGLSPEVVERVTSREPLSRESIVFRASQRSPEHARFWKKLRKLTRDGVLDDEQAAIVMVVMEDVHPSVLRGIDVEALNERIVERLMKRIEDLRKREAEAGGEPATPRISQGVARRLQGVIDIDVPPRTPTSRPLRARIALNPEAIQRTDVPPEMVMLHEVGHLAYRAYTTKGERRAFERRWRERKFDTDDSGAPQSAEEYFADLWAYYATNRAEAEGRFEGMGETVPLLRRIYRIFQRAYEFVTGKMRSTDEELVRAALERMRRGERVEDPLLGVAFSKPTSAEWPGLGEPGIKRKHPGVWESMPIDVALEHTKLRLKDRTGAADKKGRVRASFMRQKLGEIRRFALKLDAKDRSPILRHMLIEMEGRTRFDPKRALKASLTTMRRLDIVYDAERGRVIDKRSGDFIPDIESTPEAVLAADALWRQRRTAPNYDPPMSPTIPPDALKGPRRPDVALPIEGVGDPAMGEPHGVVPPSMEHSSVTSSVRFLSFNKLTSSWMKHLQQTISMFGTVAREIQRLGGEKDAAALFGAAWRAREAVDRARLMINQAISGGKAGWWRGKGMWELAKKHGVGWDEVNGEILDRFASFIDARMETIWQKHVRGAKEGTPEYDAARRAARAEQEAVFEGVVAEARARFPEVAPQHEALYRDMLENFVAPLGEFLGLDPLEFRHGFYHRLKRFRSIFEGSPTDRPIEELDPTLARFKGFLERSLPEPEVDQLSPAGQQLVNAIGNKDAQLLHMLMNSNNYFEVWASYARNGIRRKVAGDAIAELQSFLKTTHEGMIIRGLVEADYHVPVFLADRLRKAVVEMMGLPSPQDVARRDALSRQRARRAARLLELADRMERLPVPKRIVDGMRSYYRRMGVRASRGQVLSLTDAWLRLYRGQVFGFNLMASIRDVSSTNILLAARIPSRYFAKAIADIQLNPMKALRELKKRIDNNEMAGIKEVLAAPELEHVFLSRPHQKALVQWLRGEGAFPSFSVVGLSDAIQVLYRTSEVWTRLTARYASDIAVEREFKRFLRSDRSARAFEEFLLNTGMVYGEKAMIPELKTRIREAMETGNITNLKRLVADWNESQTAFLFTRYNSSPVVESTFGKLFLHFGSWPVKVISAANQLLTGPARTLESPELVAKAYAGMSFRYAAASLATYQLAAMLNIDSSDWMVFLHNGLPLGGPAVTLGQDVRALASGNPHMMRRFQKDPVSVAFALGRQAVPLALLPTSVRRAASQSEPIAQLVGEQWRRRLGLPPMQRTVWAKGLVGLGFSPFQRPLYPAYRRGGVPGYLLEQTVGRFMDEMSDLTGGLVAPGTQRGARRFEPLVK